MNFIIWHTIKHFDHEFKSKKEFVTKKIIFCQKQYFLKSLNWFYVAYSIGPAVWWIWQLGPLVDRGDTTGQR